MENEDVKTYQGFAVELFFSPDSKDLNIDLRNVDGIIDVDDLVNVLRSLADDFETSARGLFDVGDTKIHS